MRGGIIEAIIDTPKDQLTIENRGGRTAEGVFARIVALSARWRVAEIVDAVDEAGLPVAADLREAFGE